VADPNSAAGWNCDLIGAPVGTTMQAWVVCLQVD
jgi:hypothetical protein